MAARRTSSSTRRDDSKPRDGKGSGLITGLFIGLVVGLIIAAGLVWYFNSRNVDYQPADSVLSTNDNADKARNSNTVTPGDEKPAEASAPKPVPKPEPAAAAPSEQTEPARTEAPAAPATEDAAPNASKPRVDFTFYGILPGDKPAKPLPPPKSNDIWWLQVAALKNPADADKLKARLTLLGLGVALQKVEGAGGVALYRVRVGPYKREDDAFGDLDILAANNFEPRLFKEPSPPSTPATKQEKP